MPYRTKPRPTLKRTALTWTEGAETALNTLVRAAVCREHGDALAYRRRLITACEDAAIQTGIALINSPAVTRAYSQLRERGEMP